VRSRRWSEPWWPRRLGVPFVARGLVGRDGWMVLFGLAVQMAGKIWFIDRMAILYDDVAPTGASNVAP
jgi:hypothetical protein